MKRKQFDLDEFDCFQFILDIPDNFNHMQPVLIELLKEKALREQCQRRINELDGIIFNGKKENERLRTELSELREKAQSDIERITKERDEMVLKANEYIERCGSVSKSMDKYNELDKLEKWINSIRNCP